MLTLVIPTLKSLEKEEKDEFVDDALAEIGIGDDLVASDAALLQIGEKALEAFNFTYDGRTKPKPAVSLDLEATLFLKNGGELDKLKESTAQRHFKLKTFKSRINDDRFKVFFGLAEGSKGGFSQLSFPQRLAMIGKRAFADFRRLMGILPVPDAAIGSAIDYVSVARLGANPFRTVQELEFYRRSNSYDAAIYYAPDGTIDMHFGGTKTQGDSASHNPAATDISLVEVGSHPMRAVHGVGHRYGLNHSFEGIVEGGWDVLGVANSGRPGISQPHLRRLKSVMGAAGEWANLAEYHGFMAQMVAGGQDPRMMFLAGRVFADGTIELQTPFGYDGIPVPPQPGAYSFQGLDSSGQVLNQVSFDSVPQGDGTSAFAVDLLLGEGTVKIALGKNGETLAEIGASANAPQLAFLSIENSNGRLEASVSIEDADGDSLTPRLSYSNGNGNNIPIAPEWNADMSGFALDSSGLPGGDAAQLKLMVSDGFHTTDLLSDPFAMPNQPPQAIIETPVKESFDDDGETYKLKGMAFDPEDGLVDGIQASNPVGEDAFSWSSDLQGGLGTGPELTAKLRTGTHVITLEVSDLNGSRSNASVVLDVGPGPSQHKIFLDGAEQTVTVNTRLDFEAGTIVTFEDAKTVSLRMLEPTELIFTNIHGSVVMQVTDGDLEAEVREGLVAMVTPTMRVDARNAEFRMSNVAPQTPFGAQRLAMTDGSAVEVFWGSLDAVNLKNQERFNLPAGATFAVDPTGTVSKDLRLLVPTSISNNDVFTGIAGSNPTDEESAVELKRRAPSGEVAAETQVLIPAFGQLAQLVSQLLGIDSDDGWVEMHTENLRVEGMFLRGSSGLTFLDGVPLLRNTLRSLLLPMVTGRSTTKAILINPHMEEVTVDLELRSGQDTQESEVLVPQEGKVELDLNTLFNLSEDFVGYLIARCNKRVAGFEILESGDNLAAIEAQNPTKASSTLVGSHFASGGGWFTQVGVANLGDSDIVARFDAIGDGGQLLGGSSSREIFIRAGELLVLDVATLFGLGAETLQTGWINIQTSDPS